MFDRKMRKVEKEEYKSALEKYAPLMIENMRDYLFRGFSKEYHNPRYITKKQKFKGFVLKKGHILWNDNYVQTCSERAYYFKNNKWYSVNTNNPFVDDDDLDWKISYWDIFGRVVNPPTYNDAIKIISWEEQIEHLYNYDDFINDLFMLEENHDVYMYYHTLKCYGQTPDEGYYYIKTPIPGIYYYIPTNRGDMKYVTFPLSSHRRVRVSIVFLTKDSDLSRELIVIPCSEQDAAPVKDEISNLGLPLC